MHTHFVNTPSCFVLRSPFSIIFNDDNREAIIIKESGAVVKQAPRNRHLNLIVGGTETSLAHDDIQSIVNDRGEIIWS